MEVYHALRDKHPNYTVYLKDDIPERWHYRNNVRVAPIIGLPLPQERVLQDCGAQYVPHWV